MESRHQVRTLPQISAGVPESDVSAPCLINHRVDWVTRRAVPEAASTDRKPVPAILWSRADPRSVELNRSRCLSLLDALYCEEGHRVCQDEDESTEHGFIFFLAV